MCQTNEKMVVTHKWEDQGVGVAPFRIMAEISLPTPGMAESNPSGYQNALRHAWDQARQFDVSLGSCDVCGTGLTNNFVIRDANGKHFVVGCDCVMKTHDTKLMTEAKNIERKRQAAIRLAKREAANEKRRQEWIAEQDRQRQVNGGKTDAEVAEELRQAERNAKRVEMTAKNEWLINVISIMPGDFCGNMARELETNSILSLSPRCRAILRDIYGKAHGRSNSKAYLAAVEEFYEKSGEGDES